MLGLHAPDVCLGLFDRIGTAALTQDGWVLSSVQDRIGTHHHPQINTEVHVE